MRRVVITAPDNYSAELAIPRARTRGECTQEARPCPWVSCRHHSAIEVLDNGTIVLASSVRRGGRRLRLETNGTANEVTRFTDEVVASLRHSSSCSLDVADRGGITAEETAEILGVSVDEEERVENTALEAIERAVVVHLGDDIDQGPRR